MGGDFLKSEELEIMTDVLNCILSILNTVLYILDDIEQSRKEKCFCSTMQINERISSQVKTEWQMFSNLKIKKNNL